MVSFRLEPKTFSILKSKSLPRPVAVPVVRLTVTARNPLKFPVSVPAWPSTMSLPRLPCRTSLPVPPHILSSPSAPSILSLPPAPAMTSGPAVPIMVSFPEVPTLVGILPKQVSTSSNAPMSHLAVPFCYLRQQGGQRRAGLLQAVDSSTKASLPSLPRQQRGCVLQGHVSW